MTKNRPKVLENCLNHLHKLDIDVSFDVVIVDSSTDDSTQKIIEAHAFAHSVTYIKESMKNYYTFIAQDVSITKPIWSVPYTDSYGFGRILTVTMPIYYY